MQEKKFQQNNEKKNLRERERDRERERERERDNLFCMEKVCQKKKDLGESGKFIVKGWQ